MYEDFIKILKKEKAEGLYLIGEDHCESEPRRDLEHKCLEALFGKGSYLTEDAMFSGYLNPYGNPIMSDVLINKTRVHIQSLLQSSLNLSAILFDDPSFDEVTELTEVKNKFESDLKFIGQEFEVASLSENLEDLADRNMAEMAKTYQVADPGYFSWLKTFYLTELDKVIESLNISEPYELQSQLGFFIEKLHGFDQQLAGHQYPLSHLEREIELNDFSRDSTFFNAANYASNQGFVGFWKIGDSHIESLLNPELPFYEEVKKANFKVISNADFNEMLGKYETNKQEVLKLMEKEIMTNLKFSKNASKTL